MKSDNCRTLMARTTTTLVPAARDVLERLPPDLLALPDDVLLAVLRYLDVPSLLACRLVCRRFEGLSLHPHVWHHRRLHSYQDRRLMCAVLRTAPRLHTLAITLPAKAAGWHQLFATTRCAVSELQLTVERSTAGMTMAALIVRHQHALGRLRSLDFSLRQLGSSRDAAVLYGTVACTTGLVALYAYEQPTEPAAAPPVCMASLPVPLPPASLKHFFCGLNQRSAAFCSAMLTAHAATLEEVELGHLVPAGGGQQLAAMPRLHCLECCMMPEMEAVAAGCPNLEDLILRITRDRAENVRCTADFLSRATQLCYVGLEYGPGAYLPDVDMVMALASSGCSQVDRLRIHHKESPARWYTPQAQSVLSALPRLPHLVDLDIGLVPYEFFDGIRPSTAPSLRNLTVETENACAHECFHTEEVQRLLTLNPSLNLYVYINDYCRKDDPCDACALGCHPEMCRGGDGGYVNMTLEQFDALCTFIRIPR